MSVGRDTDSPKMEHLGVPNSPPTRPPRGSHNSERRGRRRWSHGQSSSHTEHDEEIHDHWATEHPDRHYGPKIRSWHHRPRSPGLKWYKEYTPSSAKNGRVLVIDYVRQDLSKAGTRKVATQEIRDITGLRHLYTSQRRDEAVLRVFHVQNADWAVQYLFKKFNIVNRDDLVDSDFGRWVTYKHTSKIRTRQPLLGGRSWPTQHDPWRGISKTAFGLDYLKLYKVVDPEHQVETDPAGKYMELNTWDASENPCYGLDVYGQRLSVYIQHKEQEPQKLPDIEGIDNPYEDTDGKKERSDEYFPLLDSLDNGNAILIFENSKSESIQDTLIKARGKWESRWRRLPFYLAFDSHAGNDDDETAVLCARTILSDIWRAVAQDWSKFLVKAGHHTNILEDAIYSNPADESKADEIWRNSSSWLRCERLAFVHQNLIEEVAQNLRELSDDNPDPDEHWLQANVSDFTRINNLVQEDLVKPTANLSDLLYKSVGIRDTRHSLELSYSMWRLSWITFIFLPLTFTVGFFGMNVDTFANDPEIKWFFISAVPIMISVLVSWYFLKWALTASRRDPYSRSVYERLYHDLAIAYPALWTRGGPVLARAGWGGGPQKTSSWQRCKWALIKLWNDPSKTIRRSNPILTNEDDRFDGLGLWSRTKRLLTRRWTAEINAALTQHREIEKGGPTTGHPIEEGIEVVQQALNLSVPGAAKNADVLHLPNGVGSTRYSVPGDGKNHAATALARARRGAATPPSRSPGRDSSGRASPLGVDRRPSTASSPGGRSQPGSADGGRPSVPGLVGQGEGHVPAELDQRVTHLQQIGSPLSSGRPSSAGSGSHTSAVMIEEREPDSEEERLRGSEGEEGR